MRITASQRHTNETRIRAAMDRLLAGTSPPTATVTSPPWRA
jgi:hypothetical protein